MGCEDEDQPGGAYHGEANDDFPSCPYARQACVAAEITFLDPLSGWEAIEIGLSSGDMVRVSVYGDEVVCAGGKDAEIAFFLEDW